MEECVLYGNSTGNEGEGCWNLADSRYWPDIKDKRSIQSLEIFFIILYAIVLTTGLIANSLTLAVFCQLKAKLLWNNNNLLILLNLCVCDNIIVFFVAPFTLILLMSDRVFHATLYEQDNDIGTVIACNTIGFLFNYCSRAILLFLSVGAMDRFVAIFIPFKYKAIVTPIRVKVSLALCHVISLLVTVVPFMKNAHYTLDMDYAACHYNFEDITKPECNGGDCSDMLAENKTPYVSNPESVGTAYFFLVFMVVIVPGLLMVVTSVAVVYRLTSRLREKEAEKKSSERGNLLKKKDTDNKRVQKVDPQEQAAVTISYLVLLYIVCYLPWWVLTFETFMEYTGSVGYRSMFGGVSPSFAHYFFLYLTITTLLSSSLNPLIYFGRNRILMDKLEDIIKYKESMAKPSLRSTISAPVMSIQTF